MARRHLSIFFFVRAKMSPRKFSCQYIKSVFFVFSLLGDFTFLLCSCFEKVQIIGIFSLASKMLTGSFI